MAYQNYIDEHKELYEKLEYFLHEFTKLKLEKDDEFLFSISKPFYKYIEEVLLGHFADEEKNLFPGLKGKVDDEILTRIIDDHEDIKSKFVSLKEKMSEYKANLNLDYKTQVLFPSYNLIATINHHAQREDREIFCLT